MDLGVWRMGKSWFRKLTDALRNSTARQKLVVVLLCASLSTNQGPKGDELCFRRSNLGEISVEDRSAVDVAIDSSNHLVAGPYQSIPQDSWLCSDMSCKEYDETCRLIYDGFLFQTLNKCRWDIKLVLLIMFIWFLNTSPKPSYRPW